MREINNFIFQHLVDTFNLFASWSSERSKPATINGSQVHGSLYICCFFSLLANVNVQHQRKLQWHKSIISEQNNSKKSALDFRDWNHILSHRMKATTAKIVGLREVQKLSDRWPPRNIDANPLIISFAIFFLSTSPSLSLCLFIVFDLRDVCAHCARWKSANGNILMFVWLVICLHTITGHRCRLGWYGHFSEIH